LKFAQICPKQAKIYSFCQHSKKGQKNGQMAKPFYFWQTFSKKGQIGQIWPLKRPNGNPLPEEV
jgi:hypothetical protein